MDKRQDGVLHVTEEARNFYRERILEVVDQIEDVTMLKKIYTVAKTLKDISR